MSGTVEEILALVDAARTDAGAAVRLQRDGAEAVEGLAAEVRRLRAARVMERPYRVWTRTEVNPTGVFRMYRTEYDVIREEDRFVVERFGEAEARAAKEMAERLNLYAASLPEVPHGHLRVQTDAGLVERCDLGGCGGV